MTTRASFFDQGERLVQEIIITGEEGLVHRNEQGITTVGIYNFLLNPNALEL